MEKKYCNSPITKPGKKSITNKCATTHNLPLTRAEGYFGSEKNSKVYFYLSSTIDIHSGPKIENSASFFYEWLDDDDVFRGKSPYL